MLTINIKRLSDINHSFLEQVSGDKSFSDFNQSTAGVIFGTDDGTTKFEIVGNSSNYISFNGSAFDIKSQTFDLDASTMILKSESSGSIALGASPPTTFESGTGFFVDGAGNLLVGSTSGNFIQFGASSGALTLKSQVFSLFTSTIVIDSSVNSGKIALGATPNSSVGGTNKGVYMDGTGDFLVRGGPDNFLKFDAGGNTLEIKSDTFDLATNNLIVDSGTNSGKIALGATSTIPSAYNNGTGFYADGTGKFKVGNSEANNINFDGTNLNISSSIFLSGSMTVGTADSGSAQPDSFISVGKPSSPHDDSGGIEIRKDYFCDFRTTHGIIHVDLVASSTSGFGNPCNGQGTGTNDYGGPEGTADNCPARTMPANNALSLIYVMGQANNGSPDDSTGTGVDASYGGSSDYFNPEIDKDNQHLLMRLVVWANATSDGGPTGQYKSGDNFTGMSGVHTGLAAGHYIGIGKGFFTEIAYIVERQTIGHQSVGKDETEDPFKGGVPYWSGGADVAKSGTARTGVAVPPNTTNVGSYYQYLSMSGYTVFRVARDCFNRGIRYENKADTPSLNPEDYVEIASLDSDGKPANDGTEAAYYLPAPTVQPHLNHTWAGAPVPHDINYDQWRDSGRKVVVFLTTPKPIPIMTVGEQGKILAVDKDVSGIVGGEVGWKLYSEFATERSAGVGSYESGLGQLDVT